MSDIELKFKSQIVSVDKINPAPYNPREDLKPGDPEYESLKISLTEHGLVDLPVWNEHNGTLISGHQRLKILLDEFHVKGVPCIIVNISDKKKERALNLALNKISGRWDYKKLQDVLSDFKLDDLEMTGFSEIELKDIMDWEPEITDAGTIGQGPTEKLAIFESSTVKQIVLFFNVEDYKKIIQRIERIKKAERINDNTTLFQKLLRSYENNHKRPANQLKKSA